MGLFQNLFWHSVSLDYTCWSIYIVIIDTYVFMAILLLFVVVSQDFLWSSHVLLILFSGKFGFPFILCMFIGGLSSMVAIKFVYNFLGNLSSMFSWWSFKFELILLSSPHWHVCYFISFTVSSLIYFYEIFTLTAFVFPAFILYILVSPFFSKRSL